MKIFIKFIVKSMVEKKTRFLLLLFAVAMSTALFIGSMGAVDAAIDSFTKPITESFEGMEIRIDPKENSALMDMSKINPEGIKDIRGYIHIQGINQTENLESVLLYGMDRDWVMSKNLIEGDIGKGLSGRQALISYRAKQDLGLEVGDKVEVFLSGEVTEFEIVGITHVEGIFYTDVKNEFALVVSKQSAQDILGIGDYVNRIEAKSAGNTVEEGIALFNDGNDSFRAREIMDMEGIMELISQATGVFYGMLLIVVLMSSLIIYGSFKLIVTERLPVIGTFYSQGATKGDVRKILFTESALYGIFGGMLGCVMGVGILLLIHNLISPLREYGITGTFELQKALLGFGLVFAVVLSVVSCGIPILKAGKLKVKNILLDIEQRKEKRGLAGFIAGTVILVSTAACVYLDLDFIVPSSLILLLGSLIGLILVYPWIVSFFTPILFARSKKFSGVFALGLHNVQSSKSLRGNITLLIISILAMVAIHSVSMSLQSIVVDAFSDMDYDYSVDRIRMQDEQSLESLRNELMNRPEIKQDSIHEIMLGYGRINSTNSLIMGIDPLKYRDFNPYLGFGQGVNKDIYDSFLKDTQGKIIVSENIARASGVKGGDIVLLEINGRTEEYEIAGIVDGKLYYNGSFIMIDNKDLRQVFNYLFVNSIYFHTSSGAGHMASDLQEIARGYGATVVSVDEAMEANLRGNRQMMNVLSVFSIIAVLIGALGALNNIIISFIQRKRDLAILSSVGMTSGQRGRMILNESAMTVLWAVVFITPYGYLMARLITAVTTFIGLPIPVEFDLSNILPFYLAALVLFILATIPAVMKNKKLSLAREIQYE